MPDAAGIEDWLREREAGVPALRPGCEKRVVWAAATGARTPLSVVYIHGFSATGEEIRPVPDRVAAALGANLHFTRLTGHGQDGEAMGRATLAEWRADVAEALEVGRALGDRVLVIGCSTGCTLAALAAADGEEVAGLVLVSPNFGLTSRIAQALLDLPGAQHWAHRIVGAERSFDILSEAHEAFWTCRYPTRALYPMGDAVRAVWQADLGRITAPTLVLYSERDQVVRPALTRKAIARWGGPLEAQVLEPGEGDDAMAHLICGDIFSPGSTQAAVERILSWFSVWGGKSEETQEHERS